MKEEASNGRNSPSVAFIQDPPSWKVRYGSGLLKAERLSLCGSHAVFVKNSFQSDSLSKAGAGKVKNVYIW